MKRMALVIAGLIAAVVTVGVNLQLVDRFGTYAFEGDLVSRSRSDMLPLLAVGVLLGVALMSLAGALLAPAGQGARVALSGVGSALLAGLVALVAGVGTAAALQFDTRATTHVAVLVTVVYAVVLSLRVSRLEL